MIILLAALLACSRPSETGAYPEAHDPAAIVQDGDDLLGWGDEGWPVVGDTWTP